MGEIISSVVMCEVYPDFRKPDFIDAFIMYIQELEEQNN